MEAIIFIGIQASKKSTFYRERFFNSHVRISLDLLNTRNKQEKFLETCFATQTKFVVDNTSPTLAERKFFIEKARANKYKVVGYYFKSSIEEALKRNSERSGKERIPDVGILGCYRKLVVPNYQEGFDQLFHVKAKEGSFIIKNWADEV